MLNAAERMLELANDLLADDAIDILAARELRERLGNQAEVVDSYLSGLARRLELEFPQELVIFAVEVADPLTVGGAMTPAVRQALPELVEQVQGQVTRWQKGAK